MLNLRKLIVMTTVGVLLCGIAWVENSSGEQRSISFEIDYPRPVNVAARQVEREFGYVVTYEDSAYRYAGDLIDLPNRGRQAPWPSGQRPKGMRNGTLSFRFTPPDGPTEVQVRAVLEEVIRRSRQKGNPGDFRLEASPGGFHIVPSTAKDTSGEEKPYDSPLESRITMALKDESVLDMLTRFSAVVSRASGQELGLVMIPQGGFHRTRVQVEAQNDKARDVLWRALQSIDKRLSYQVLCDPKPECGLSVHAVPAK